MGGFDIGYPCHESEIDASMLEYYKLHLHPHSNSDSSHTPLNITVPTL